MTENSLALFFCSESFSEVGFMVGWPGVTMISLEKNPSGHCFVVSLWMKLMTTTCVDNQFFQGR